MPMTVSELRDFLSGKPADDLVVVDFVQADGTRICRNIESAQVAELFKGGYPVCRLRLSDRDLQRSWR